MTAGAGINLRSVASHTTIFGYLTHTTHTHIFWTSQQLTEIDKQMVTYKTCTQRKDQTSQQISQSILGDHWYIAKFQKIYISHWMTKRKINVNLSISCQ